MATPTRGVIPRLGVVEVDDVSVAASGLDRPEGPVLLGDGSVLVAEIAAGRVTRIDPDGTRQVVATCGGGPNGLAIGPSGHLYACNNGGPWPERYTGGRIDRIDLSTGEVEVLYDSCDGHPLSGPNDLAFDDHGGFWFTDHGKVRGRQRDLGAIYHAAGDGSAITEAIFPVDAPNGIGVTDGGRLLCFAETFTARLFTRDIVAPGLLADDRDLSDPMSPPGRLACGLGGLQLLDSLAVHPGTGEVCIGTLITSCITVVDLVDGSWWQVALPEPLRDPVVSNLCFTPDGRRAFVTLTSLGLLVSFDWPGRPTPG